MGVRITADYWWIVPLLGCCPHAERFAVGEGADIGNQINELLAAVCGGFTLQATLHALPDSSFQGYHLAHSSLREDDGGVRQAGKPVTIGQHACCLAQPHVAGIAGLAAATKGLRSKGMLSVFNRCL